MEKEGCYRATEAGENQEGREGHDQTENHDEGKTFRGIEQFKHLLHMRIRAACRVLLEVGKKRVVDFFSRAKCGPQRENDGSGSESQNSGKRTETCAHANRDLHNRISSAVEHRGQKARCQHAQSGRGSDED